MGGKDMAGDGGGVLKGRLVPLLVLLVFFLFAGALLVLPLIGGDRAAALTAERPVSFSGQAGTIEIVGEVRRGAGRDVAVGMRFSPADAVAPGPRIFLEMPGHEMEPLAPDVERDGNLFAARLELPMEGLWHMVVAVPQGQLPVRFRLDD